VCELDAPAASTAEHDLATVVQACGSGAGTEAGTESPLPPLLRRLRLSPMLDSLTLQPATLLRLPTLAREFESSKTGDGAYRGVDCCSRISSTGRFFD
jgi:hypothetical protein